MAGPGTPGVWFITPMGMQAVESGLAAIRRGEVPRPDEATTQRPSPFWTQSIREGDSFQTLPPSPRSYRLPGGVAVLELKGTIYTTRTALSDMLAWAYGGVMLDEWLSAFGALLNDQSVRSVLLDIDSPGGSAASVPEAAAIIRAASKKKTVCAFTSSQACSAAYYLGAAAGSFAAHKGADVGSVGAVIHFMDDADFLESKGYKEMVFVSSVSPDKWPDPKSAEGAALFQSYVDRTGEQFVSDVARFRGVSASAVKRDFGRGWIVPAQQALEAGMIDRVAGMDQVISWLQSGQPVAKAPEPSSPTPAAAAGKVAARAVAPPAVTGRAVPAGA